MNGREAVKALMDGRSLRRSVWPAGETIAFVNVAIFNPGGETVSIEDIVSHDDWEIDAGRATSADLIAAWEKQANDDCFQIRAEYEQGYGAGLMQAAKQLRERRL